MQMDKKILEAIYKKAESITRGFILKLFVFTVFRWCLYLLFAASGELYLPLTLIKICIKESI